MPALTATLTILLASAPIPVLQGQEPHRLGPGENVRIYQRGLQQSQWRRSEPDAMGTILTITADSLALLSNDGAIVVLPISSIADIEVNRGPRSNWLMGMTAGAVVGAGAGLVIGLATKFETDGCYTGSILELTAECQDTWTSVLGTMGIGAAGGALLGAVIGTFIKTDQWGQSSLEGQGVRLIAGGGRFGFSATVTF